jgi:hypothetical protein
MRIMVAHPQVTCQWVDTEGSFSPARARKVVEGLHVQVGVSELPLSTVLREELRCRMSMRFCAGWSLSLASRSSLICSTLSEPSRLGWKGQSR